MKTRSHSGIVGGQFYLPDHQESPVDLLSTYQKFSHQILKNREEIEQRMVEGHTGG